MRPKVTVIVPFYNSEKYICECVESLLNQTLKELEIICIDDGSTDDSSNIVQGYAQRDDRIILISKPNKGYGHSMNLGLDLAKGEYVGILESDDYVVSSMFERLYDVANKNDLDFVKSDFSRFYRIGDIEINQVDKICKGNHSWYCRLLNPSVDPNLLNIHMHTWTGIYKSEFIDKYGIRYNETPGASYQDIGFWFQTFCLANRAMFLNETFYHLRRDNPNSSIRNKEKVYSAAEEYEFILEFLKENPDMYEHFIRMYHKKKYNIYMFTLNRIDDRYRLEFLELIQKEFSQAQSDGELEDGRFTSKEWNDLLSIMGSPKRYYKSKRIKWILKDRLFEILGRMLEGLSKK